MFLPDLVLAGEAMKAATAMLSASGFHVFDLGVDVSFDDFALKAKELQADIVGLSALLTTTMIGVGTKLQPAAQPCEDGASSTCSHRLPNS